MFSIVAGLAFIFYPLRDSQLLQIEIDLVDRRLVQGVPVMSGA